MNEKKQGTIYWQLLVAIAPAIIAIIYSIFSNLLPERINYVSYLISKDENFINLPYEIKDSMQIWYKDSIINNLSVIRVYLYNDSENNLQNVEIHFELEKSGNEEFTLISHSISGPEGYPKDGMRYIKSAYENIYIYEIGALNRPIEDTYIDPFTVEFIFLGENLPDISIGTSNVGLQMRCVECSSWDSVDFKTKVLYFVKNYPWRIIILSVMIALTILYFNFDFRLSKKYFLEDLKKIIDNQIDKVLSEDVAKKMAKEILSSVEKNWISSQSWTFPIKELFNKKEK